jgi:hypothetical protein
MWPFEVDRVVLVGFLDCRIDGLLDLWLVVAEVKMNATRRSGQRCCAHASLLAFLVF